MPSPVQAPPDLPVVRFDSIDSTSRAARADLEAGRLQPPILYRADRQTRGVGRFGRRWESPEGGLWMTLVWPLPEGPGVIDGLGLRVGLACRAAVADLLPSHPAVRLKWPNDVYLGDRKALGILVEVMHAPGPVALVGVGVNVNNSVQYLPEPLRARAVSLAEAGGGPLELDAVQATLVASLMRALGARTTTLTDINEARAHLYGVGRLVRAALPDGSVREGRLETLDDRGAPVVTVAGVPTPLPPGAELSFADQ